ncbi:hypothetical protein [Mucilaginibacter celer]|uniref:GIY-YIG domain-containing protein n=1 Tax=Mucilaginibacter celer TaxID=2305508 RepID=A0A494VJJ8_9SPHI|nr:hypothetical protein [Mucilaginibacter celer]AYL93999.1 hypothetical protein HYN43_001235 [Mucilaginibacter celer]
MFDELNRYKDNGHFFFTSKVKLSEVCNAPSNKSGVYLVYALAKGRIELIYIGRSGKRGSDGLVSVRRAGLGGIKDRIVNGHQFGKVARKNSWPSQILIEDIEALDVYWYVTSDNKNDDCPSVIENLLLKRHLEFFGKLPRWNKI